MRDAAWSSRGRQLAVASCGGTRRVSHPHPAPGATSALAGAEPGTPKHHKTNLQANTWHAPLLPAAPFRIRAAPDTIALTAPRAVAISIGGVTVIAPYSTAAPVRLKFMGGRAVIPRPATTAKRVATGVRDRRARLRLLRAQHQKCPCSSSRCVFAQLPDCLLTAD